MSKLNEFKKVEVEGDFHLDGYLILRSFFDANEITKIYNSIRLNEVTTLKKINNLSAMGSRSPPNWLDHLNHLLRAPSKYSVASEIPTSIKRYSGGANGK